MQNKLNSEIKSSSESGCLELTHFSLVSVPNLQFSIEFEMDQESPVDLEEHPDASEKNQELKIVSNKQIVNVRTLFNEEKWLTDSINIPPKVRSIQIKNNLAYWQVKSIQIKRGNCPANPSVCTFESNTLCNLISEQAPNQLSTVRPIDFKHLPNFDLKPQLDTTFRNEYGHFLTLKDSSLDFVKFNGPLLKKDDDYVIKFNIYNATNPEQSLRVYAYQYDPIIKTTLTSSKQIVWSTTSIKTSLTNEHMPVWMPVSIHLKPTKDYQLEFQTSVKKGSESLFALDDFLVEQRKPFEANCDFLDSFCDFYHDPDSYRLFIRSFGRLQDLSRVPNYAVPPLLNPKQSFIYLDLTNLINENIEKKTTLLTDHLPATDGHCLTLTYNSQKASLENFDFQVLRNNNPQNSLFRLKEFDNNSLWKKASLTISSQTPFVLAFSFKYRKLNNQVPYFALGQVQYQLGACPVEKSILNKIEEKINCEFQQDLCDWKTNSLYHVSQTLNNLRYGLPDKDAYRRKFYNLFITAISV